MNSSATLMDPARRRMLRRATALGAAGLVPGFMMSDVQAQSSASYRALVCIFLIGGNDSNNMIVPVTSSGYATYSTSRGAQSSGGLSLPQSSLLPLVEQGGATNYGFHPSMTGLQSLWQSGNLATLYNVGSLIAPLTKAQVLANSTQLPTNLYSHYDQQVQQAATALPALTTNTGWGGRIADLLPGAGGSVPVGISVAGNALFLNGSKSTPVGLPQSGALSTGGFASSGSGQTREAAFLQLAAASTGSVLMTSYGTQQRSALSQANILNPVLQSTSSVAGAFSGLTSSLSQQFAQVAKIIENRGLLGNPTRQLFFVSLNGFDTHSAQISRQAPLLTDLSASLSAFYSATVQLGVAQDVTSFTLSDFTRTLKPAADAGSDHAWGGHHIVVGGSVLGQKGYGTFPSLVLSGDDDVSDEGRWLPTTSVDQYAATLAAWFGISSSQMAAVFPNLRNFASASVGFMSA